MANVVPKHLMISCEIAMKNLNVQIKTDGSGWWSDISKLVVMTGMELAYVNDEKDFGELRVCFDTNTWDVENEGLIYTDFQWLREFKSLLDALVYDSSDVSYSEQGMQGDNYVSLDVGEKFIKSWA